MSFQEFIFLVGVKEGSVILTFMISEQYADQLKDLFEKHKDSFRQFGVDGIFVVDPPTVDEQSLDPRTEREENKEDFSTQTYLELAPVGDIQSQLSAMYYYCEEEEENDNDTEEEDYYCNEEEEEVEEEEEEETEEEEVVKEWRKSKLE
ncbi:hypothetical protein PoB_007658600 [Plakobranchus ocellatus]|uniref:Uncharacterized protein n=1 Tax=Plakobranchus ocellatus TaxID=259542 RepID=A0AAV4E201_9GAST|nr:hypothetical protein PoB_007658600 [Plakobranchus ocellatus]